MAGDEAGEVSTGLEDLESQDVDNTGKLWNN